MMIEMPIAFGLTMVVCLSLFFYCWYIRKLRYRLTSVQVSATPNEVQEPAGMKKEVVDTFPTVTTHELAVNIKDELQCPICLAEYANTEVLRKLPYCGHVFHIHCVDSWLQKHVTCPVCRIVLTEYNPKPETLNSQTLPTSYCRVLPSTPNSGTIEISPATPSWVLVNRPLPLPPSTPLSTSHQTLETLNSSESRKVDVELQRLENLGLRGESPLLPPPNAPGWGAVYVPSSHQTLDCSERSEFDVELQRPENIGLPGESPLLKLPSAARCGAVYLQRSTHAPAGFSFRSRAADIALIESKECIAHASISERWMAESFSFGISTSEERVSSMRCHHSTSEERVSLVRCLHSTSEERVSSVGCFDSLDEVAGEFRGGRRRGSWRSRVGTKSWDFGRSSDEEVVEKVGSPLPLTVSPEHCSFEFLPIVTGPGGDYSLTDFHR